MCVKTTIKKINRAIYVTKEIISLDSSIIYKVQKIKPSASVKLTQTRHSHSK